MIFNIKTYVKESLDYGKRYARDWDYFILANDAYMAGFRSAREQAGLPELGNDITTIEQKDGEHMLTRATFEKWKKENYHE